MNSGTIVRDVSDFPRTYSLTATWRVLLALGGIFFIGIAGMVLMRSIFLRRDQWSLTPSICIIITWRIEMQIINSMLRIILMALIISFISGCAIHRLETGINSLIGQPVSSLIDVIGFPSEEKVIANRKIYIWQISSTHFSPNTQTSTYSGMVGTKPVYGTATTYGGTNAMPVSCKLTVEVDSDEKITHWVGEGSEFGCEPYASRFN